MTVPPIDLLDAQTTLRRFAAVKAAAAAGKHVYCEKPTAIKTETPTSCTKSAVMPASKMALCKTNYGYQEWSNLNAW